MFIKVQCVKNEIASSGGISRGTFLPSLFLVSVWVMPYLMNRGEVNMAEQHGDLRERDPLYSY